jgi:transposase-like protein
MNVQNIAQQVRLRQWAESVEQRYASGKTVKEWCKENNIHSNTYYYRLRRTREAALVDVSTTKLPDSKTQQELQKPIFAEFHIKRVTCANPAVTVKTENGMIEVYNGAEQDVIESVLLALKRVC